MRFLTARFLAVVSAMTLASFTGCGGDDDGPLFQSTDAARVCTPSSPGGDLTVGDQFLANIGDRDAVLQTVRLVDPVGVDIIEARLLEIGNDGLVGVFGGTPAAVAGKPRWDGGTALTDATLSPGEEANLVLWLRRDGSEQAGFERIEVEYRSAGGSHRWRSVIEFETVRDCSALDWTR